MASFIYDFNFFRNKNGFAGKFLRGWSVNGIVNVQDGIPLAVTQATNFNAFAGFGVQHPNRLGDPQPSGFNSSTAACFDTTAFAQAAQFTIGTSSRNPARGPGYRISISRLSNEPRSPKRRTSSFAPRFSI